MFLLSTRVLTSQALTPAKVQERAETPPSSPSVDGEIDSPIAAKVAPTPTPRKSAPKRAKTVATFRELTATGPGVTPVVVFYDGQNANAKVSTPSRCRSILTITVEQRREVQPFDSSTCRADLSDFDHRKSIIHIDSIIHLKCSRPPSMRVNMQAARE